MFILLRERLCRPERPAEPRSKVKSKAHRSKNNCNSRIHVALTEALTLLVVKVNIANLVSMVPVGYMLVDSREVKKSLVGISSNRVVGCSKVAAKVPTLIPKSMSRGL